MTDFSVTFLSGDVTNYSGDAARYELNPQSGVLTVFDGEGKRMHFSVGAWLSLTDEAPTSVYGIHDKTTA